MAANGVDVKVGVSGVAQFKTSMNQAKQAVKTLDAQLALSEKQFKANGDAQSYMTEKAELLKAKLEQQKTVLSNAEKALKDMSDRGVDKASKAYQDMYRQMLSAKGALIDTQTQMDNMTTSTDEAASGVSEMNSQLTNIGKGVGWQNVTEGFDKITAGVEKAAKKVWGFGRQVVNTMLDAGSWGDDLKTRAEYYMMTPEQLQRAEKTSKLIDTSVDSIVGAQRKLKRGLGKQDKEAFGAIVELMGEGYDPTMKNWEDVFWDAGEALMRFTDEEEKEVYAQKLFGKSWNELIPLFKTGRTEYEKMNESWTVVSQESIDALGEMDDEYQKLMANWETFKYEALAQFATPMKDAMLIVNDQLGKVQEWLKSEEGQDFVKSVIGKITEGMKWLVEHRSDVVEALKYIVIGWAGIKLTGGALHILQLINGAKNLFGGGGGDTVTKGGGSDKVYTGGKVLTGSTLGAKLTGFMSNAQIFSSTNGGSIVDWMLNNSPWAPMLNGNETPGQWWNRMVSEQQERAANFGSNWDANSKDANVLAKLGKNSILFWDGIRMQLVEAEQYNTGDNGGYVAPETPKSEPTANWEFSDDWTIEEQMAWVKAQSAAEKMEEAAADLSGDSDANRKSSSDMSTAAGTLKGMPGQVEEAILRGMGKIRIFIDGQQAGGVLTPYVNNRMGDLINALVK